MSKAESAIDFHRTPQNDNLEIPVVYQAHGSSSTSSFPQHPRISKGNHGRIMYNNNNILYILYILYIYIYNILYILYILYIYTWCIHNRQYDVSRIFSANICRRKLLAFKELVEQAERQGLGLGSELEPDFPVSRWVFFSSIKVRWV